MPDRGQSETWSKAIERRKHKLATIYLWQEDDGTFGATWDWGGTWDHAEPQDALLIVSEAIARWKANDA